MNCRTSAFRFGALCAVTCNALFGFHFAFLAVPFPSQILASVLPLRHPARVTPGSSSHLPERQRSPSTHFVRSRVERLVGPIFSFFCPKGKARGKIVRKMVGIGPWGPLKAILGPFLTNFSSWSRRAGIFTPFFINFGCRCRFRAVV